MVFLSLVFFPITLCHLYSVFKINLSKVPYCFIWSSRAYLISSKYSRPQTETLIYFSKYCFSVKIIFNSQFSLYLSSEMHCAVFQWVQNFFKMFIKQRNRTVSKSNSGFQTKILKHVRAWMWLEEVRKK